LFENKLLDIEYLYKEYLASDPHLNPLPRGRGRSYPLSLWQRVRVRAVFIQLIS